MNRKDFAALYDLFNAEEGKLLRVKREEYVGDLRDDVLTNFKQGSTFEGRRPEEYCMTLIIKHIQSLQRAVADRQYCRAFFDEKRGIEGTWQRISDVRNYLLLLAAIIEDGRPNANAVDALEKGIDNESGKPVRLGWQIEGQVPERREPSQHEHSYKCWGKFPSGDELECSICGKHTFLPLGGQTGAYLAQEEDGDVG